MDSEKQKPITDEYRKNWERIYLQQEARKEMMTPVYLVSPEYESLRKATNTTEPSYRNGCPILSEGPQKDDL